MTIKKILIISHVASKSGAPILLLNLAIALQESLGCKTDFLLKAGGTLLPSFIEKGNTFHLYDKDDPLLRRVGRRILKRERATNIAKIDFKHYDLILANTILNGDILPEIRKYYKGLIFCYIHELKVVADYVADRQALNSVISHSDFFIAPCADVKNNLVNHLGVPENLISILPYYIPSFKKDGTVLSKAGEFTVGGCGTIESRKGTDLFVLTAKKFTEKYPSVNIRFVWKGANKQSLDYRLLAEDVIKLGLEKCVIFEDMTTPVENFYSSIDVFLLTSREDPYPLVVLEAADFKIPSICFALGGGAVEFVENNGKIVDYLSVDQMADAILYYYNNPVERKEDGQNAYTKLVTLHQDKITIANQFAGFKTLLDENRRIS